MRGGGAGAAPLKQDDDALGGRAASRAGAVLGQHREKLETSFGAFEVKHGGQVLATDLGLLMRQEGYAPTEAQLARLARDNNESSVTLARFLSCCEEVGYEDPRQEELAAFFEPFDPDGTGRIPTHVFRRVMESMGERCSPAELLGDFLPGQESEESITSFHILQRDDWANGIA